MNWSDRRSGRVEYHQASSPDRRPMSATKANDYSRSQKSGSRLSRRRLQEMTGSLSERDHQVLAALRRTSVLSGAQLERLAFFEIAESGRGRVRRRVLGRLVDLRLVVALDRRVGGVRAGSAGLVYALSAAGHRLLDLEAEDSPKRRRAPHTPGQLFLAHALAISEIYVGLVEKTRTSSLNIETFDVEADARWQTGPGDESVLRPDALVVVSRASVEDVWWLEVDRGSESLPRLKAMLHRYLEFANSGQVGPRGVVPRVLISLNSDRRVKALRRTIGGLPNPAGELFAVCRDGRTVEALLTDLIEPSPGEPP